MKKWAVTIFTLCSKKRKMNQIRLCNLSFDLDVETFINDCYEPEVLGSTPEQLPEAMHLANVSCLFIKNQHPLKP